MLINKIRNFSIIAHINHGKSTLADRLIEFTNSISDREKKEQILDNMELEREKGITIKSQVATLSFQSKDSHKYILNLIDTPGHVDFAYEVSRSLTACDGVLLLIDATQGIEAQTIANMYQALEHDLTIIPVINKVDLMNADVESVSKSIEDELGLDKNLIVSISAKTGLNIDILLEHIVNNIKPPKTIDSKLKALIFDAYVDDFRGVICSIRVFGGEVCVGDSISFFQHDNIYKVVELGHYKIQKVSKDKLSSGEVGYIVAHIKTLDHAKIGDTITLYDNPCDKPLEGYKEVKSMVFSGVYPIDTSQYNLLKDALSKLRLNDASLTYENENSSALGFGFRCGFLGLLHLEIISERLVREFNVDILNTSPSVCYEIILNDNSVQYIDNPNNFPEFQYIQEIKEPFVMLSIITPKDYLGDVIQLCHDKRGIQKDISYIDTKRAQLDFEIPLAEIIYNFHDKIKSITQGYASYDYNLINKRKSDLVKLDILVNFQAIDAFSQIVHRSKSVYTAGLIVNKLKDEIPRQMFQIPIQAAIGSKILVRQNIKAFRKDVISKCYGGDVTRKRKLLEKQKEGKRKMKSFGSVNIPKKAFISVLKVKS